MLVCMKGVASVVAELAQSEEGRGVVFSDVGVQYRSSNRLKPHLSSGMCWSTNHIHFLYDTSRKDSQQSDGNMMPIYAHLSGAGVSCYTMTSENFEAVCNSVPLVCVCDLVPKSHRVATFQSFGACTGGLSFPIALATWLSELPAIAETHNCTPAATSMMTVWLQALADISQQPHACTFHLQPVYQALNGVLAHHARGLMHCANGSHPAKLMHESMIDPVAELCWASPLATATILSATPRAMNLLVASVARKFASQLAIAAGTVAADTAPSARAARCAAFRSATDMMHAMGALSVVRANQRVIVSTGIPPSVLNGL